MKISQSTRILILVIAVTVIAVSCSGKSDKDAKTKKRRDENKTSSTKKQVTLPPISSTTSSTAPQNTKPIAVLTFLSPDQIKAEWTSSTLCSLVSAESMKQVLQMDTVPKPKYSFSNLSGARCTYSTGSGDEAFVELSITSYSDSRSVDKALMAEGDPVIVNEIGGVVKANTAIGTTYELNISGDKYNQWTVNGPSESKAKKFAELVIAALS